MKINSIQRDISLKYGGSGLRSKDTSVHKSGVSMCENNTGINTGYCGSFTGKSEAAASFLDKILKSMNSDKEITCYSFSTSEELGYALGKPNRTVAAITDKSFAEGISAILETIGEEEDT